MTLLERVAHLELRIAQLEAVLGTAEVAAPRVGRMMTADELANAVIIEPVFEASAPW